MPIPSFIAPSTKSWLGVARELTTGTPVLPTNTIPLLKNTFEPEDTPRFLPDEAIRGVMSTLFGEILGPEDATFSYGGPAFLDVEGFFFDNVFGDLSTVGSSPGSQTTLSANTAIGATSCTVGSISGYTSGGAVQIDTGTVSEVVILSQAPAGSTLTFANNPLRFAHSTGATVATVTGPYTHKFALLNSGSGQPPTHTFTDYTGLTASVGARSYPSACLAQCDFTGNAEQLLDVKTSGNSWISAPAGTTPTNTTNFVVPVPNWRSTITVGGSTVSSLGEWALSCKRQLQVYFTAQGSQNPYIIARGGLSLTGTFNYTVASDESPLTQMLSNTQPAVVITVNNGQVGVNQLQLSIQCSKAAFVKSKIERSAVLIGYNDEFEAISNTSDAGGTGGLSPGLLTLINNFPTY
jgi:hypothetical protein